MLEQLLAEIRSGGALEVGALAKKLDASPQLVEAMLEHLQRAGYIRPYENCGEGCNGCSLKAQCDQSHRNAPLKLWQG
ncbi:MAG: FeoC-like transcriptional regulator [Chloroflexota bacterium]